MYLGEPMNKVIQTHRDDYIIAGLAALAITIHVAESALPSPMPGVKPGLANVVTLAAFFLFGLRVAVWVSLLRVLVGSLFIGTFLSPTFILSFSGAACSIFALAVAYSWMKYMRFIAPGPVGLGVVAAMAHMVGQFYAAYWMFIPHKALFNLLPILMTAALIFGIISGLITISILSHLKIDRKFTE